MEKEGRKNGRKEEWKEGRVMEREKEKRAGERHFYEYNLYESDSLK